MFSERLESYIQLEKALDTKLLVYITSDRQGWETQIGQDAIDHFIKHLDSFGPVRKISLFLYTRGGDTAAAWNIINLLRIYCDELQVIVPHKAHSAGTLISIGANSIIMTKQATLGPIDPSLNTSMNPPIPNHPARATYPVSVEAVKGYLAFAREELLIKDDAALANILIKLSDSVHPLVLGQVFRTRAQIKMLAEKLLKTQITDSEKLEEIISFLCSDSGSHDYTINRREAKEVLGLNIIKPSPELYTLIQTVYNNIAEELGFGNHLDLRLLAAQNQGVYSIRRCLIESITGGSHCFLSSGQIIISSTTNGQISVNDNRQFEGWKYEQSDAYGKELTSN